MSLETLKMGKMGVKALKIEKKFYLIVNNAQKTG